MYDWIVSTNWLWLTLFPYLSLSIAKFQSEPPFNTSHQFMLWKTFLWVGPYCYFTLNAEFLFLFNLSWEAGSSKDRNGKRLLMPK